jgi:hypothetical protein
MAKSKKRIEEVINSEDSNGDDKTVVVVRPDSKKLSEAQKVYNKYFRDALESGALLRQRLDGYMREQGIWNDKKEAEYQELTERINANEKKIASGGIKLSQAKEVALEMRTDRISFRSLISERNAMDSSTAEGQSDNARFNYLVSVCLLDDVTRKPLFSNVDDYDKESSEPYVVEAAGELASMMYNLDPDYENTLPENKFLKRFKFVDGENRLVNKEGHLIDSEGRLINEDGRFVAYEGDELYFIDKDGARLNEDGDYVLGDGAEATFIDDVYGDGEEVVSLKPEEAEAEAEAEAETEDEAEEVVEDEADAEEAKAPKRKRRPKEEVQ